MGEYADIDIERFEDIHGRRCGGGYMAKSCDKCGAVGLRWKKHETGKWWLATPDGQWHTCSPVDFNADESPRGESDDNPREGTSCEAGS